MLAKDQVLLVLVALRAQLRQVASHHPASYMSGKGWVCSFGLSPPICKIYLVLTLLWSGEVRLITSYKLLDISG